MAATWNEAREHAIKTGRLPIVGDGRDHEQVDDDDWLGGEDGSCNRCGGYGIVSWRDAEAIYTGICPECDGLGFPAPPDATPLEGVR